MSRFNQLFESLLLGLGLIMALRESTVSVPVRVDNRPQPDVAPQPLPIRNDASPLN